MIKRRCASALIALATAGLVGCESTDFNFPGKNATESQQTAKVGKRYSPNFDDAQLASGRLESQASVVDNKLFTLQAGSDSRLAIEMAKLAEQKSGDVQIRRFASRISQQHQTVSDQIKMLAQARNYAMADALLPEQQKSYDNLAAVSANGDFDRHFIESEIHTIENAIQLYRGGSGQLTDNELRSFAARTLPELEDQLQSARDLMGNMGSGVR